MTDQNKPVPAALEGLNPEQLAAAQTLSNVVITAGAGSGKTHVLSHRYAWLVTELGYAPEEILTLTFTNKAASEMYQRIYQTLAEFARNGSGTVKERSENAIKNFHKARIQTLDSYCNTLAKTAIHHYGISPQFTLDTEQVTNLAERLAITFVLEHKNEPVMQALIGNKNPADIATGVFAKAVTSCASLANPRDFAADTERQIEEISAQWEGTAQQAQLIWENCYDAYQSDGAGTFSPSCLANLDRIFMAERKVLPRDVPLLTLDTADAWQAHGTAAAREFIDAVLAVASLRTDGIRKGAEVLDRDTNNPIKQLRPLFVKLALLYNYWVERDTYREVAALLNRFEDEFHHQCRTQSLLTFQDVAQYALKILLDFPEIRAQEKRTFRAIMIDEFQDDNALQRDLLFLLAEKADVCTDGVPAAKDLSPEKLFFVGDEKQSIYRFRGADVSVFMELSSSLASGAKLRTNYRSKARLIQGFNKLCNPNDLAAAPLFSPLPFDRDPAFEEYGNPAEFAKQFEATYTPAAIPESRLEELGTDRDPLIHLKLFEASGKTDQTLTDTEMQAFTMARTIREKIDSGAFTPSDFAILERRTSNQSVFERALRDYGIPYSSENVNGFFDEAPSNDLYALLRLIVYPTDTVSYATVLKSPFAGVSGEGLSIILTDWKTRKADGTEKPRPFAHTEPEALLPLNGEDAAAFGRGKKLYESLVAQSAALSLCELLTYLWYTAGYRYETLWTPKANAYAVQYDYLFELAHRSDLKNESLVTFVDELEAVKSSRRASLEDMDIPLETRDAVRIMTVHKSKGLQFKVVFVPELESATFRGEKGAISFTGEAGVLPLVTPSPAGIDHKEVAGNWFEREMTATTSLLEQAELRRLLYVAITRAENEVFLLGTKPAKEGGGSSNSGWLKAGPDTAKSFYQLLRPAIGCFTKEEPAASPLGAGSGDSGEPPCVRKAVPGSPFTYEVLPFITREEKHALVGKATTSQGSAAQGGRFAKKPAAFEEGTAAYQTATAETETLAAARTDTPDTRRVTPSHLGHTEVFGRDLVQVDGTLPPPQFDTTYLDEFIEKQKRAAQRATDNTGGGGDEDGTSSSTASGDAGDDLEEGGLATGERFGSNDFGTMAHAAAEALLTGNPVPVPADIAQKLDEKELAKLEALAKEMAEYFIGTTLGKKALQSGSLKSEYTFKSRVIAEDGKPVIVDGQIDLVYEVPEESAWYCVDFKSDWEETPLVHANQLACYKNAIEGMFQTARHGQTVRCFIYYLRTGHYAEITSQTEGINLRKLVG